MIRWDYSPSSGAKLRVFPWDVHKFCGEKFHPNLYTPNLHTSADFLGKKAANTSRKTILVGG